MTPAARSLLVELEAQCAAIWKNLNLLWDQAQEGDDFSKPNLPFVKFSSSIHDLARLSRLRHRGRSSRG